MTDHQLLSAYNSIQHKGRGVNPDRKKMYVHFSQLSIDENFLVVADLGIDVLYHLPVIRISI